MAVITKTTNIDVKNDIGQVLVDAGGSVDLNNPLTYFKSAANINRWSFNKPISYAKNFDLTDDEIRSKSCGLTVTKAIKNYESGANMSYNEEGWGYALPSGGSSSPCRLGDFIGYNTLAVPPLRMAETSYIYDEGTTELEDFYLECFYKVDSHQYGDVSGVEIAISDLKDSTLTATTDIGSKKWGIIYIDSTGASVVWANAMSTFRDGAQAGADVVPPLLYPAKSSGMANVLNNMSVGETIKVMPIINLGANASETTYDTHGTLSQAIAFPTGEVVSITKQYTPLFTLYRQGNLIIKHTATSYYKQTIPILSSSDDTSYAEVSRYSTTGSGNYEFCVEVLLQNTRSTDSTLNVGQFSVQGLFSSEVVATKYYDSGLSTAGYNTITVPANTTTYQTFYLVFPLSITEFESQFPYLGYATADVPKTYTKNIRIYYKGKVLDGTINYAGYRYSWFMTN